MTSFAGMSLCTVVVALIPAWHDVTIKQRARFKQLLRQSEDTTKSDDMALDNVPREPPSEAHDVSQNEQDAREEREQASMSTIPEDLCEETSVEKRHRWLNRAKRLLGNLCDLQLLTGTAIIIAAYVQGNALSFYHQTIIINYWWLALNSFWAARQDESWEGHGSSQSIDTGQRYGSSDQPSIPLAVTAIQPNAFFRGTERFRSYLRRLLVFVCTTAFCILYGRALAAQDSEQWDPLVSGRCYRFHDQAAKNSDWFWLAGLALYALVLLLSLVNKTKKMVIACSTYLHSGEDKLFEECVRKWRHLRSPYPTPKPPQTWKLRIYVVGAYTVFVGMILLTLIYSACLEFLSIWWFGDGLYVLEVAFYLGMWAWSFYDIVDLKISNRRLIVGKEMAWGFGQVLAVVLMGALVFNVVDGLGEEKERNEERGEVRVEQ